MSANEHDDDQPDGEDVIDALRARVEDMRQANIGMEADRDSARAALREADDILSTLSLSSIRRALIIIRAALSPPAPAIDDGGGRKEKR